MYVLPGVLNNFNAYAEGEKLIGIAAEVDLPELAMMNDTIDGAGIMGAIEDPAVGQFGSLPLKLKWSEYSKALFDVCDVSKVSNITLRGSQQVQDAETGYTDYRAIKIVLRVKCKGLNLGTMSKAKKLAAETDFEILYIKVVIDKETCLVIDKLNFRYAINGKDLLKKIRKQI